MDFDFTRNFPKPSFSSMSIGVDYPLRTIQTYLDFGIALLVQDSITETVSKIDSLNVKYKKQQFSQRLTDDISFEVTDSTLIINATIEQYTFVSFADNIKPFSYYNSNDFLDTYLNSGYLKSVVRQIYYLDLPLPRLTPLLYWNESTLESLDEGYDYVLKVGGLPFNSIYRPARSTLNVPRLVSNITLESSDILVNSIPPNSSAYQEIKDSYLQYFFQFPADYAYAVGLFQLGSGSFNPPVQASLDNRITNSSTVNHNYTLSFNILTSGTAPNIESEESNSNIVSLGPTGVAPGTYGSSTQIPVVTFGFDGRATEASTVSISLSNTGVNAGSYGSSTHVATFTVGSDGRLTSASNVSIASTGALVNVTAGNLNPLFNSSVNVISGTANIIYTQQTIPADRFIGTNNSGTLIAKTIVWSDVSGLVGTSENSLCVGNDPRLTDSRPPTGSAGGDLAGNYPNPTVLWASGTSFYNSIYRTLGNISLSEIESIPANVVLGNFSGVTGYPNYLNLGPELYISGTELRVSGTSTPSLEQTPTWLYEYFNLV